jgi:hypothetical protein
MKQAVLFVLLLIPSALFSWFHRDMPQLGVHHDDSIYWVTAKSLGTGQGYRILSFPGEPFQTKYPPLYPALLSLVWKLDPAFPRNVHWAALLAWLMMPVYLLLVKRVMREFGFSTWWAWGLTAAIALNVTTVLLGLSLMSELAFSIVLLCVLVLAERNDFPSWAVGLLAGIAFLVRSTALPLALTVPLCFWIRGRRKDALLFSAGMFPVIIAWQTWVRFHQFPATDAASLYYTNYLGFHLKYVHLNDLPILFWSNLAGYFSGIGQLLIFNPDDGFWATQLSRITSFSALMGVYRLARKTGKIQFVAYGIGLSAMLLLWHYAPSARFLYALFPLLLAGFATEVTHILRMLAAGFRKPKNDERIAAALASCAMAAYLGLFVWFTYVGLAKLMPAMLRGRQELAQRNQVTYEWIRSHTAANATFLANDDAMLYLYTNRHAMGSPVPPNLLFLSDDAGIDDYVKKIPSTAKAKGLDYIFLTDTDFSRDLNSDRLKIFRKAIEEDREFEVAFTGQRSVVYRYRPRPEP